MTCEPLADTGLDAPVLVVLVLAVAFLVVGLALLRSGRRCTTALLLVVLVLVGGITVGLGPAAPASADCPDRPGPAQTTRPTQPGDPTVTIVEPEVDNSLTITQTSVMDDLRPGAPPEPIAGLVVNNGPDDTFITAIVVDIVGVVQADDAVAGSCVASDYLLLDVRMPVGRPLAPYGGSTTFAGARIGFNDKATNQDACQGATVRLRYRPSA